MVGREGVAMDAAARVEVEKVAATTKVVVASASATMCRPRGKG